MMLNFLKARQDRDLSQVLCLDDFEIKARRHLPRPLFGYIAGASETNASLRHNRAAFEAYALVPRILRDVSSRRMDANLLGETFAAPIGIAPMGISALMAYRGDLILAEAAAQADIPMIMSGSSLIRMEDVVAAAPRTWFQAYLPGEPDRIDGRVQDAGSDGRHSRAGQP